MELPKPFTHSERIDFWRKDHPDEDYRQVEEMIRKFAGCTPEEVEGDLAEFDAQWKIRVG